MNKSGIEYASKKGVIQEINVFGYKDVAKEHPINKDTTFPLASGGKFFVAISILQLLEKRLLSLDTKLRDVLNISYETIDPDVTVFQLLTHTSGVPDYADEELVPDYAMLWKDLPNYKVRGNQQVLDLFIHEPMKYPKGSRFEYNNSGFVLLGMIVETLSNQSFDDYIKDKILNPLRMKRTGYFALDRLPKNTALGILTDDNLGDYSFIYSIDAKGSGAGGIFSSVGDLDKLIHGVFSHKILKKETVDLMMKKHVDQEGLSYGLGVWLDDYHHLILLGEDPGVSFVLRYDPKQEITCIGISNRQHGQYATALDLYKKYK